MGAKASREIQALPHRRPRRVCGHCRPTARNSAKSTAQDAADAGGETTASVGRLPRMNSTAFRIEPLAQPARVSWPAGIMVAVIVNGKVVYSKVGWIAAAHPGSCGLCGANIDVGADIIRVSAHHLGGNWASTCCAARAEEASGYWERFPNAPRRSTP